MANTGMESNTAGHLLSSLHVVLPKFIWLAWKRKSRRSGMGLGVLKGNLGSWSGNCTHEMEDVGVESETVVVIWRLLW